MPCKVNMNMRSNEHQSLKSILGSFQSALQSILNKESNKISYQLTYDKVYRICKLHEQKMLLECIDQNLRRHVLAQISHLEILGVHMDADLQVICEFITKLSALLEENRDIIDRVAQTCLFLDVNYCQREMNIPLRSQLNEIQLRVLIDRTFLMDKLACVVFVAKLKAPKEQPEIYSSMSSLLQLLNQIDDKEEFFSKHFLPIYLSLIHDYYQSQSVAQLSKLPLEEYLFWAKKEIIQEKQFCEKHFQRKKGQQAIEQIVKCIFDDCYLAHKQRIYSSDEHKLFVELTLPLLQLLRYGKNKEIDEHIVWYMGQIEKQLNKISLTDNTQFMSEIWLFYNRVNELLKPMLGLKFDINYRSVFAFEEWINQDKLSIAYRLNHYIHYTFLSTNTEEFKDTFLGQCLLVFRLMKEKNLFENIYRRLLIDRITQDYAHYDIEREKTLVQAMQKECGIEWAEKIFNIGSAYIEQRKKIIESNGCAILQPLIVDQADYPYQQKTHKVKIHADLLVLAQQFTNKYLQQNKDKKLFWHPIAGTVILTVRYKNHQNTLFVTTTMANLLLYFNEHPKLKLSNFLNETGHHLDEVEKTIRKLIDAKVLRSDPVGQDTQLILNEESKVDSGSSNSPMDLVAQTGKPKFQRKQIQELKSDRKMMVEALIVKILKAQKQVARQVLMDKIKPLLMQKGYNFNQEFVSKSIDRLLDKQFLSDIGGNKLSYVA